MPDIVNRAEEMNALRFLPPGLTFSDGLWYVLDGYRREHPGELFERRPDIDFDDAMRFIHEGYRRHHHGNDRR